MRTRSLLWYIIASIIALFVATLIVPNVSIEGETIQYIKVLLLSGLVLGLINYFIKPLIKTIVFPLRLLTFGLINLVINILIVWCVDILFLELSIEGLLSLFLTSLIVWIVNIIIPKKKKL